MLGRVAEHLGVELPDAPLRERLEAFLQSPVDVVPEVRFEYGRGHVLRIHAGGRTATVHPRVLSNVGIAGRRIKLLAERLNADLDRQRRDAARIAAAGPGEAVLVESDIGTAATLVDGIAAARDVAAGGDVG